MKRVLLLLIVGGLMVAAFFMPEPDSPEPVATTTPDTIVAPSIQAFAFCPWASTEGLLDAHLAVLAADSTVAKLTFPSAGEIRDTRQLSLEGLAGVTFGLGSMPFEGQMPSVVEFTSDASVGVVAFGETMLVGSGCAASIPKIWVLPGGSTQAGDLLELQLFNPFPEDARVNVVMTSEGGFEPEESLDALSVNARSWRTIDISSLLPLRGSLAATIEVEKGVVIPAFLQIGTEDQALWTGVERADRWEFPLVTAGGLEPFLVLSNPTALEVGYAIDRYGVRTSEVDVASGVLEPGRHARIPLGDLFDEPSGFEVRADGLVGAVIVGESEVGRAATGGAYTLASTWLVPGLGSVPEARNELWILNTSASQVTVTWAALNENGTDRSEKVAVAAGSSRSIRLPAVDASGFFIQATAPITIGASMIRDSAVAYLAPVPLPEP